MLNVRSISRSYGDFKAVADVSFDVGQGEVVGLLGHNGAGKTTIMKMLSGYLEPDEGCISFNNTPMTSDLSSLQRELGYLPEHLPVYPELSVASYLDYAAELKGLTGPDKRREVRCAIEATELSDKLLSPIDNLSRGLKQRVGVAQAILGRPSLLILDEPTNGLDPGQTDSMRRLIRSISEHATIILSTHIMQEVEAVCDRALIIRQGRLAVDKSLKDLTQDRAISLKSSASDEHVRQCLESIPAINTIQTVCLASDSAAGHWSMSLMPTADMQATIAACTAQLVNNAIPVMGIGAEVRDLQTLFLEVSNSTPSDTDHSTNTFTDTREAAHVA